MKTLGIILVGVAFAVVTLFFVLATLVGLANIEGGGDVLVATMFLVGTLSLAGNTVRTVRLARHSARSPT